MRKLRLMLEGEVALYAISNEIALDLPDLTLEAQGGLFGSMETAALFCGVEVLCRHVTSRGYGALVRVSPPDEVDEVELIRRVGLWYGERGAGALVSEKARGRKAFASLCAKYRKKMYSIIEYASLFQRRFSVDENRLRGRYGPVWRQRFRSYLLEDIPEVRTRFAGYLHTRPHGDPDMGVLSTLFQAESGDESCRRAYRALTGKGTWASAQGGLEEAIAEMGLRAVRPSCGAVDSQKIEAAQRRSRERHREAVFTDAMWMGFYDEYQQFVKANGCHRFPQKTPHYDALRYWVSMQRIYLRRGSIGAPRRELLESISFPVYVNGKRS